MRTLERLLGFIAPEKCLGCNEEGLVVCDDCFRELDYPPHCIGCKKPSLGGITCKKCRSTYKVDALYVCSPYSGMAKECIGLVKYRPSQSIARNIGSRLAELLPYLDPSDVIVCHVPTTPQRIRDRGFDQSAHIAKGLAIEKKYRRANLLRRISKSHQVGSGRRERIDHMRSAFVAKNTDLIQGKTVLLVDDVLTTGATIQSASRTLKDADAQRVLAVVFARAE